MNVLVTGGLGFLGINLVNRLLDDGHRVVIFDPKPAPLPALAGFRCLAPLGIAFAECSPQQRLVEHWEGTTEQVGRAFHKTCYGGIDLIYHLGATASPPWYKGDPIGALYSGSLATHEVANLARHHKPEGGPTRVIFTSTSEVYGDPEVNPQPETYRGNVDSRGPRSMYDEAKRYAEAYLTAVQSLGWADVRIARVFNTFGPHMSLVDGRMIPEFIRSCILGRPLHIHGDGNQTRTLCYVSDLVNGLVSLAEAPAAKLDPARDNGAPPVINLGGPWEEMTVNEVAEMIRAEWGPDAPPVEHIPHPCAQDPKVRRPALDRAQDLLGYHPTVTPQHGIKLTIRSMVEQHELG